MPTYHLQQTLVTILDGIVQCHASIHTFGHSIARENPLPTQTLHPFLESDPTYAIQWFREQLFRTTTQHRVTISWLECVMWHEVHEHDVSQNVVVHQLHKPLPVALYSDTVTAHHCHALTGSVHPNWSSWFVHLWWVVLLKQCMYNDHSVGVNESY